MIGNYAFKKSHWRWLARALDQAGYLFFHPPASLPLSPKKALIVRMDQLGDIVQTLPFLDGLAASFPGIQIDFLTTPAGAALMGVARPAVNSLTSIASLPAGAYDAAFELRGDIRLIWRLKKIRPKVLIGYGATGGGFLLDVEPAWTANEPAIEKNLRLLAAVGGRSPSVTPRIEFKTKPAPGRRLSIAVHPDAGTSAKRWPVERYIEVIDHLIRRLDAWVVLVGLNKELGESIAGKIPKPLDNQMGKTDLKSLVALLADCDGLLSNDSGPAHLMAALGKPVWVVWSGTADPAVWSPRGAVVELFQNPVACAPCSLPECPVPGHPCLNGISSGQVADRLVSYFQPSSVPDSR